jgi:protein-tyrosine kinase
MGRIAEALKKAERERVGRVASGEDAAVATLAAPARVRRAEVGLPPIPDAAGVAQGPTTSGEGLCESLVAYHDRLSPVSEQYRALRTRLLSHNPQNEHRVMAVTSSTPKEGKTITTLNLGFTLAEIRHHNILLVDADFRRSSLAQCLNLRSSPGLAELLTGEATYREVIQHTPVPNLHFVAAGVSKNRSAPELLSDITARAVFRWFESQYHFTVIDTPPATTVTDVGIIGQFCSGVIMVVRMHRTPEPLARRAVRLLQVNNVPILGCVLVGRDGRSVGYGYRSNDYTYYDEYVKDRGE